MGIQFQTNLKDKEDITMMKTLLVSLSALTMVAAPVRAQYDNYYPAADTYAIAACKQIFSGANGKEAARLALLETVMLHPNLGDMVIKKGEGRKFETMTLKTLNNRCGKQSIPVIYATKMAPLARELGYEI